MEKLTSSIQLNKELIAQVISQQEHIKSKNMGTMNQRFQPGKHECRMKNIHSPFGKFPSTHFKDDKRKVGPPRKPLYEKSYAKYTAQQNGALSLTGVGISNTFFLV